MAEKVARACGVSGTHSPQDVFDAIDRQEMQAWTRCETLVVTIVEQYPQAKWCRIFLVAGDLDLSWEIVETDIKPWARGIGCTRLKGDGRLGWGKSARARGWSVRTSASLELI